MQGRTRVWLKRLAFWVAVAALLWVLLPPIMSVLGLGMVVAVLLLIMLGAVVFLVGLPFFSWIMAEAGLKVFVTPYYRAWHINHIRNNRLLKEAADRGRNAV
jgi:hypothetical protein